MRNVSKIIGAGESCDPRKDVDDELKTILIVVDARMVVLSSGFMDLLVDSNN